MILTGLSLGVQTPTVTPRHYGSLTLTGLSLSVQSPSVSPRHSGSMLLTGLSLGVTNGEKPVGGFVQVVDLNRGACILTPSAV